MNHAFHLKSLIKCWIYVIEITKQKKRCNRSEYKQSINKCHIAIIKLLRKSVNFVCGISYDVQTLAPSILISVYFDVYIWMTNSDGCYDNGGSDGNKSFHYNFKYQRYVRDTQSLTSDSRLRRRKSSSLSNLDFCSGTTLGILKKNLGFGCSYNPIESYGIMPARASFIILCDFFLKLFFLFKSNYFRE